MKQEDFAEILGNISEDYIIEAKAPQKTVRPLWVRRWGVIAACLAVIAAVTVPRLSPLLQRKGDQGVPSLHAFTFNGAYYEILDMEDTALLDAYNLPHEITEEMVGQTVGDGLGGSDGERIAVPFYQYLPYAELEPMEDGRTQRAVYVAAEEGEYSFALFCNYLAFDSNTHQEAREMFAVYGVTEAADLRTVQLGGRVITDPGEIETLFEHICQAESMGNDDYQRGVFDGMTDAQQQQYSQELSDSAVEIRLVTADGLVINNLRYYPTIHYLYWALNYYKLSDPIPLS